MMLRSSRKRQLWSVLLVFAVVLTGNTAIFSNDGHFEKENLGDDGIVIDIPREEGKKGTRLDPQSVSKSEFKGNRADLKTHQENAELIINATHIKMSNEESYGVSSAEVIFQFVNGSPVPNSVLEISPLDYPEIYYRHLPFSLVNVSEGKWQLVFSSEKRNGLIPQNYTYVILARGGINLFEISQSANFTLEILDTPDNIPPTFELKIKGKKEGENYYNITTQRLNISLHVKDTRKVYHSFINSSTTEFAFPSLPVNFDPVEKSYYQEDGVIYYVWYNQTDMSLNYSIPPNWPFLGTWEGNETFTIVVSDLAGNLNVSQPFVLFGDNKPPSILFTNAEEMDARIYSPDNISLEWQYQDMHPLTSFTIWIDTDGDQKVDTMIADQYQKTSIEFAMPSNFSLSGVEHLSADHLVHKYYPFFVQVEGIDRFGNKGIAGRSIKINITALIEKSSSLSSKVPGGISEGDEGLFGNKENNNSSDWKEVLQGLILVPIIFGSWLLIRKRYTRGKDKSRGKRRPLSIRERRKKKNM